MMVNEACTELGSIVSSTVWFQSATYVRASLDMEFASNLWKYVVMFRICCWCHVPECEKKRSMVIISPSMDHQFREWVLAQWLWAGITVIAALCLHSAILLMSSVQPLQIQAAPKAQWDTKEVFVLLEYLTANKSQGNGTRNFKDTMFIGAATAISPLLYTGPPKIAKHCKMKWVSVSLSVFFFFWSSIWVICSSKWYTRPLRPILMFQEPTGTMWMVQTFRLPLLLLSLMHILPRRFIS